MLSALALLSGLFLTSVVLVDHSSPLGVRAARHREIRKSSSQVYSPHWGGVSLNGANNTFTFITSTFNVPALSGSNGTDVAVWAGIDGKDCGYGPVSAGIYAQIIDQKTYYVSFADWSPGPTHFFQEIDVRAGDTITVNVTTRSHTSGIATVENHTTGQKQTMEFTLAYPLCQTSANLVVKDFGKGAENATAPYARFDTVTFSNGSIAGPSGTYTPCNTGDFELELIDQQANNGSVVTCATLQGCDVVVKYV